VDRPVRRSPQWVLLVVLGATAAACAAEEASPAPVRLTLPELRVSPDPSWTGRKEGEPVVAEVGGIPIPAERYRRALAASDPGTDPGKVLDDLIVREMLAQAAVQAAVGTAAIQPDAAVYQKALATRLLKERFVDDFPPSKVPLTELQEVFKIPQVYRKFNHLRQYSIQDYQWICCGGDTATCSTPDAHTCFQEGGAVMEALRETIAAKPPESVDLPFLVDKWRVQAPRLSYQEFDFAYDDVRRVQKGSMLFDTNVVNEAVATQPGHFASKAVRSGFGWHVMFVRDVKPPENRDLSDPDVRREIAEFFHSRFQQKQLVDFLATLLPFQSFRQLEPALKDHPPATRPRYDVHLFIETLAAAIEATQARKEEEPM